ncbi:MAG: class I SAM-dependent methyltransferase [Actinomycetota bacterium]|nr:class I SAM-dependent methyltransferase [Actinomycetota bacterium]
MAQNIYDDEQFFTAYGQLPRSSSGLDAAPEWPALRAMLPPLHGLRVVDLGSGPGWFCQWAATAGAEQVLGIDLSEKMLATAREHTAHPQVSYERQDLDALVLPPLAFDVAYCSLTLHYLTDLPRLLTVVAQAVVPGGVFVCSLEHPVFTAPSSAAFVVDGDGDATWPLDRYFDEGPRITDWLAPGVVKQHRTLTTYVTGLLDAGFALTSLVEWGPSSADLAAHPDWAAEAERPAFLLLGATRLP